MSTSPTRGPSSNVTSAIGSLILPGLGQLFQARPFTGLTHFVLACAFWIIGLGWLMHLWSCIDASIYQRR